MNSVRKTTITSLRPHNDVGPIAVAAGMKAIAPGRTITDADADAIAERVVAQMLAAGAPQKAAIVPNAIYTVDQAAALIGLHPETVTRKLRIGRVQGTRRAGRWRINGAELLRMGGSRG